MALALGDNSGFVLVAPTADPAGTNTTIDGSSVVTKDTSPTGATKITQIGWYRGSGTNTANFEVALYSDSVGVAATRLFVDNTNSSASGGWITVAVDWAISANTPYWLSVQMDAHSGSSTIDTATSGGAGTDVLTAQTTLNNPYGGGAVADADGMYAIYALVNTDKIVLPNVGGLALIGFPATVVASANQIINAGLGALLLTSFAPTIDIAEAGIEVLPGTGESVLSGYSPSIAISDNKIILPNVGVLTVEGFAVVISVTDYQIVNTGTAEFALIGVAPVIQSSDHKTVNSALGELIFSGFSPTVTASSVDRIEIIPGLGAITVTGFAPCCIVWTDIFYLFPPVKPLLYHKKLRGIK